MSNENWNLLPPSEFESFLERFRYFSNDVVREFHLVWSRAPSGNSPELEIVVETTDPQCIDNKSDVRFRALEVDITFWHEDWQGTIGCGNVILRQFDGRVYLAVGHGDNDYSTVESFNENQTLMFAVARRLLISIGKPCRANQAVTVMASANDATSGGPTGKDDLDDIQWLALVPSECENFLDRFYRFGDGVIREFHLLWANPEHGYESAAEMIIDAMDRSLDGRWSEIRFRASNIIRCFWSRLWQGTIECSEVVLRYFGERTYFGVSGFDAQIVFSKETDFSSQATMMFVDAGRLSYSTKPNAIVSTD